MDQSPIVDITRFLTEKNFKVEPKLDGKLLRFDRDGSNNAYFSGRTFEFQGKVVHSCIVGDWKTGEYYKVQTKASDLTTAQLSELNQWIKDAREREREEKEKVWREVAPLYEQAFGAYLPRGTTPYLERKGLTDGLYGARILPNPQGDPIVAVPMRDIDGVFWNFQRIYSQKLSKGDKFFQLDGKIEGCFHSLDGKPITDQTKEIYLAEGFATAGSIYLALDREPIVLACFNAGNLRPVAESVRGKYPTLKIIVCADNDHATLVRGKVDNVGLRYGRQCAGAVKGELRYPRFRILQKGFTDFNDLHTGEGLEKVKDQLLNPGRYVDGIEPMNLSTSKNGKTILPTSKEMGDYILNFYGDNIIRHEKSLFRYNGTHWFELDVLGLAKLKQKIGVAAHHELDINEIDRHFKYILEHCRQVPRGVNLFQPNPARANFKDGTLHIEKTGRSVFKKEFKPHDKSDYLLATLPFDYPQGDILKAPRPLFLEMLGNRWSKDSDRGEKVRFYKQTLGCALTPVFTRIIFFVGPSGSGKSTDIKLLVKLIGLDNCSTVQPCDMNGFNLASMPGKLINYDTDVDINKPINDSLLKKIIDRMPMRVRRKNKDDVLAYLPSLHLYACNSLPPSLDGASQAFERRVSIIRTGSWAAGERHEIDFEDFLLETESQGIAAEAVLGLEDLIQEGGHFSNPESSLKETKEMQMQSDVVGQFLQAITDKEVHLDGRKLFIDGDAKMKRPDAWVNFKQWQEMAYPRSAPVSRIDFFNRMRSKGFKEIKVEGFIYFRGVGFVSEAESTS